MDTEPEKTVLSGPPAKPAAFLDQLRNSLEVTEARRAQTVSRFIFDKLKAAGALPEHLKQVEFDFLAERDGPYTLGRMIAQGGMGAVIEAQDQNLKRTVALKVILSGADASPDLVQRFVTEARITGQLQHPNIVPLHELGVTTDGVIYYTMRKLDGEPLSHVLDRLRVRDRNALRDYPLPVLLTAFQKVCDAIAFAHSRGVIHRDLKPENIMLGDFGEVMVVDWGLAKVMSPEDEDSDTQFIARSEENRIADDTYATLAGEIKGTPRYMAPEQAVAESNNVDERTDIYALGAILYSILTLHPPVSGETVDEVLNNVATGAITSPTQYNYRSSTTTTGTTDDIDKPIQPPVLEHCPDRRIPASLSAVAMKALARRKERRYQNVAELQKDIEAYQLGFATSAESAGLFKQLWLLIRRHRAEFSLAAAALITIVILAGWFTTRVKSALDELKEAAPAFYSEARSLTSEVKFAKALARINYALKLRPDDARFHALHGNLLQSLQQFNAAVQAYEIARELDPSLPYLEENLRLSRALWKAKGRDGKIPAKMLTQLHSAMRAQRRTSEAIALDTRINPSKDEAYISWRTLVFKAGLRGRLTRNQDELMQLKINNPEANDLEPLKGMPLNELDLSNTQIADLTPLAGMQLISLDISRTKITDLQPVNDMPLRTLHANDTALTSLAQFAHLHLETLHIAGTPIQTLDLLTNLPLRELRLDDCKQLTNLAPLTNLTQLERLTIPGGLDFTNLLPHLPSLRKLGTNWPAKGSWKQVPDLRMPTTSSPSKE